MTVDKNFNQLDNFKKSVGIKQNIKNGEIDYFKNILIFFFLLVGLFIIINLIASDENIPIKPVEPVKDVKPKPIKPKPIKPKPIKPESVKPKPVKPVPKPVKPKPIEPPKVVKEKKLKDVIKEYKTKSPYDFCWYREKETNDDSCYFF
jgi:hypothetical protein